MSRGIKVASGVSGVVGLGSLITAAVTMFLDETPGGRDISTGLGIGGLVLCAVPVFSCLYGCVRNWCEQPSLVSEIQAYQNNAATEHANYSSINSSV